MRELLCESCRHAAATVLVVIDRVGFRVCADCAAVGVPGSEVAQ